MLEKLRGKTIMFVGDSLSKNHWLSLLCMIHSSVPSAQYVVKMYGATGMTAYTFTVWHQIIPNSILLFKLFFINWQNRIVFD